MLTAHSPFDPDSYSRRDSIKYLKIAKFGYFETPELPKAGNAGWFPGYPLAMRAGARLTGARPVAVGRALSALFHLGLLAVLARLLLAFDEQRQALALLVAAFFPGSVYYNAVFPISLSALLSLSAIALCSAGRYLAAGAAGALGAFTYPSGFLVAGALATGVMLQRGLSARARAAAAALAVLPCLLGLAAVLLYHQLALGRWDAFFEFQRGFGHQAFANPLATLADNMGGLWSDPHRPSRIIGLQAVVVAALLAAAAVLWWRGQERSAPLQAMLMVNAAAVWLFPLVLGRNTSTYRHAALLVCITPLLARLPHLAFQGLLVLLVALSVAMSVLFFDDVLV